MRLFLSISVIIIFLLGCSPATRFGAGVDITFDPRTIGMQIDDTIMQKNLVARLSLNEKNILLIFKLRFWMEEYSYQARLMIQRKR